MGCNCGRRGIEARQKMRAEREQRALARLQAQQQQVSVQKQVEPDALAADEK